MVSEYIRLASKDCIALNYYIDNISFSTDSVDIIQSIASSLTGYYNVTQMPEAPISYHIICLVSTIPQNIIESIALHGESISYIYPGFHEVFTKRKLACGQMILYMNDDNTAIFAEDLKEKKIARNPQFLKQQNNKRSKAAD